VYASAGDDQIDLGSGNDTFILGEVAALETVDASSGTADAIAIVAGVTVANTFDFGTYTNFEKIVANGPSTGIYSISLKADADTDMTGVRTIDLSSDTNTTGTNVVDLSLVSGTYTVIGSSGVDQITGSVGVDYIDVSATSNDEVTIAAAADTGVLTTGAASTATTTIDVIKAEAGDTIDVTAIVQTDAWYDGFATITESGNLGGTVSASTADGDTNALRARGIYDADAGTFTHATVAGGANAVLLTFAATDAGTSGTDSIIILGVTDVTSMTDGVITL
jgi:hypothetical protein